MVGEGSKRDGGDGVPAHQLAWDFDLVIATFQQLSSQWSRHQRGDIDGAPLLQVRCRQFLCGCIYAGDSAAVQLSSKHSEVSSIAGHVSAVSGIPLWQPHLAGVEEQGRVLPLSALC